MMSLEYKVELKKEDELETLYSWYISEIDQDDNEVKSYSQKCIPWRWSVDFKIKNISYQTDIELENESKEFDLDTKFDKLGESYKTTRGERLFANLKLNEQDYDTKLSMFGTKRKIDNITLEIYKADEEYCHIYGGTEYSSEINFRDMTIPDCIEISLGLKEDDYKDIVEKVKDKSINTYFLSLGNVNGFYSPWSPETSTSEIKVLTSEHEINIPENILPDDYELPRLGVVGNFSMISRFSYELIKEDKFKVDYINEHIELNDIEPIVPLSTSERIQEETKEELSKLLSLIEKQQKYIYWGFVILIITIVISSL